MGSNCAADEAAGPAVRAKLPNLANLANFSWIGRGGFFTCAGSSERQLPRCVHSPPGRPVLQGTPLRVPSQSRRLRERGIGLGMGAVGERGPGFMWWAYRTLPR